MVTCRLLSCSPEVCKVHNAREGVRQLHRERKVLNWGRFDYILFYSIPFSRRSRLEFGLTAVGIYTNKVAPSICKFDIFDSRFWNLKIMGVMKGSKDLFGYCLTDDME